MVEFIGVAHNLAWLSRRFNMWIDHLVIYLVVWFVDLPFLVDHLLYGFMLWLLLAQHEVSVWLSVTSIILRVKESIWHLEFLQLLDILQRFLLNDLRDLVRARISPRLRSSTSTYSRRSTFPHGLWPSSYRSSSCLATLARSRKPFRWQRRDIYFRTQHLPLVEIETIILWHFALIMICIFAR